MDDIAIYIHFIIIDNKSNSNAYSMIIIIAIF